MYGKVRTLDRSFRLLSSLESPKKCSVGGGWFSKLTLVFCIGPKPELCFWMWTKLKKNWSKRSACNARGCWHKCKWPLSLGGQKGNNLRTGCCRGLKHRIWPYLVVRGDVWKIYAHVHGGHSVNGNFSSFFLSSLFSLSPILFCHNEGSYGSAL